MPGWRAHRKECWFIAVEDILCEFLAHSLVLEILKWANRHGPIKKGLSKNKNKDGGRKEVGASTNEQQFAIYRQVHLVNQHLFVW